MKTYDLTELALRNLRESSLRNSLTTIGISVGVASLVAMLSLGIGLQKLATRHLAKSGLFDTVVVMSRRDLRGFSREDERSSASAAESRTLDESARQEIERLPNVLEAYPDVRFITELRYQDKPHLTMVSGIPESARSNDAFSGIQGNFFSSETAPEVILQKSFAAELLDKVSKPGQEDEIPVAELARPLVGQELTMRYAQRVSTPPSGGESAAPKPGASTDTNQSESDAAYSVVSREQKLKIVGVSDLDPDSMRGAARARMFLPLKLAEDLHVMQPSDLRDNMRGFNKQPSYSTISVQETWVQHVLHSRRHPQPEAIFCRARSVPGNLWQPGSGRGFDWYREYAGHGNPGAPPRDRNHESHRRQRRRCQKAFLRRSRSHGSPGRHCGRDAGMGHRPCHQPGHKHLSEAAGPAPGEFLVGAVVAGWGGHCFCLHRQPGVRPVSRGPRRAS
jgi:hypothetical protein